MKQIAMKFFPIYIFLSFSAIIFSQQLSGKVTYVASNNGVVAYMDKVTFTFK